MVNNNQNQPVDRFAVGNSESTDERVNIARTTLSYGESFLREKGRMCSQGSDELPSDGSIESSLLTKRDQIKNSVEDPNIKSYE